MIEVLAVDGGQSGVRARHSSSSALVEVDGVSRREGDTIDAIVVATAAAWTELGSPVVDRAVLGLTTAPTDAAARDRLASSVASAIDADEVWVCDDTVTAHAGALAGDWGVSLRAGTGVACLAVAEQGGEPVVVDGHGYLLGDDGAAFSIGRAGLRAVLRRLDGRGGSTALTAAADARFGGLDDLHVRLHDHPRAVNEIAQFSRDVVALADEDAAATAIIATAAAELAETVAAAVGAVDGQNTVVPVALGGRLLDESPLLRERLVAAIASVAPVASMRAAAAEPLEGALGLGTAELPDRYGSRIHHFRRASTHA